MTDTDAKHLQSTLEGARQDLARSAVEYEGNQIAVTASFGAYVGHAENLHDLICEADKAMYEAKRTGRNKVIVHTQMTPTQLASDLPPALASPPESNESTMAPTRTPTRDPENTSHSHTKQSDCAHQPNSPKAAGKQ
jgi:hypothetical protein